MDEFEAMRCHLAQSMELNANGSLNLQVKLPNTEALTAMTSTLNACLYS